MILLIAAVAVFAVVVGLYGVIWPVGPINFVRYWRSKSAFWFAATLRLILGMALWVVAPASRAPFALQVIAVISIVTGISLPLMGFSRYEALLIWWQQQTSLFVRTWCLVAMAFGVFLLWSVLA